MSANAGRDMVFCHNCERDWFKAEHGLQCPQCDSDFVEVIESSNDPRATQSPAADTSIHTHNPWPSPSVPDPDEEDISHYDRTRRNIEARRQAQMPLPPFPPGMMNPFSSFLGGLGGPPPPGGHNDLYERSPLQVPRRDSDHSRSRSVPGSRVGSGPRGGEPTVRMFSNVGPNGSFSISYSSSSGVHSPQEGFGGPNELHGQVLQSISGERTRRGGNDPFASLRSNLLSMNMGIMRGQHMGDFVSDQNLDQIISQLMEQHATGSAPGPASQAAIEALPQKAATKEILGGEAEAECTICQENVKIGDKVTVLPCHHWFTHDCIEAWLKEHDTCPICRKGIMPKDGEPGSLRRADQEPMHNEDPAVVARRQSGTRENPTFMPESPSADRRRRHSSQQPGLRRHSSSRASRTPGAYPSNSSNSGRGSTSGGSGSIFDRARNMFSSGSGGSGSRR